MMKKKDLQERFEVVFRRWLELCDDGRMEYSEVSAGLLFVSQMGIIDVRRHLDCVDEVIEHSHSRWTV